MRAEPPAGFGLNLSGGKEKINDKTHCALEGVFDFGLSEVHATS